MIADRVKELSAATGTGAITLTGAVTGFESFNTAFGVGPSFDYCIESIDGTTGAPNGSWEIGTGHLSGATTLVRDTVRQSSNADALVAFAAGTKNVFCTLPASVVIALQAKLDDAPSDGKTYGRKDAVWAEAAGISALTAKEDKASKGIANGYASLDASTKVPAAQLPSYVDDVLEFANLAAFPATGAAGIIYVALDTGKIYRWSGSAYVEISPSPGSTDAVPEGSVNLYYTNGRASAAAPVQSVAGRTGAVTLMKTDVGLANADNTSDANKPLSTAQKSYVDAADALKADKTYVDTQDGLKAPLASPVFTGNPTAPTPTAGDNDTSIATTAFVTGAVTTATVPPATVAPVMDGVAAVGVATKYAREDHKHPSDTIKADKTYVDAADALRVLKAGDTMTGQLVLNYAGPTIVLNGVAGNATQILGQKAGVGRWILAVGSQSTETGSGNVGSDFALARFTDAGAYIDNPLQILRSSGNMGVGNAAPVYKLDVGGDINITGNAYKPGGGSWTAPSDARIKQVLGDYKSGLAEVCKLSPVTYVFKGNYYKQPPAANEKTPHQNFAEAKTKFVGLIAQQAEIPMPEMVTTEAGYIDGKPVADLRVLDTTALIFALVNACKELAARIEALEQAA